MGIQLFSDLIDGFEKLLKGVKAIANLTQEERERYQQTLSEAYRLMNVTVTMVIVRLGDIRRMPDDKFLDEVARLDNYEEWLKTEREFRLCQSLRVAVRETETLPDKVKGAISIHDWDALLRLMQSILASEGDVASVITTKFSALAKAALQAAKTGTGVDTVREETEAFRQDLIAERMKLVDQEAGLYKIV